MNSLIRNESYSLYSGTERFELTVQELVWGLEPWPEKFRVQVPESNGRDATSVYGATSREAVEAAVEYLASACVARSPLVPHPATKRLRVN